MTLRTTVRKSTGRAKILNASGLIVDFVGGDTCRSKVTWKNTGGNYDFDVVVCFINQSTGDLYGIVAEENIFANGGETKITNLDEQIQYYWPNGTYNVWVLVGQLISYQKDDHFEMSIAYDEITYAGAIRVTSIGAEIISASFSKV